LVAETWSALQEALLLVFAPIITWWLVFVVVGGVLSLIGTLFMEIAARITR